MLKNNIDTDTIMMFYYVCKPRYLMELSDRLVELNVIIYGNFDRNTMGMNVAYTYLYSCATNGE
jgi:hypothetical protein